MRRLFIPYSREPVTICIDPEVYLAVPFIILLIPINVFLSWLIAAIVHELGHIVFLSLFNGKITKIRITTGGAIISGSDLCWGKNIVCTLAGPVIGVLPVLFIEYIPVIGLFSLMLTIYNLLPFYPLDGGRILRIICNNFINLKWLEYTAEYIVLAGLCVLALCLKSVLPLVVMIPPLREKYLANRRKRGYNSATIKVR